jgi:hypothetical protein
MKLAALLCLVLLPPTCIAQTTPPKPLGPVKVSFNARVFMEPMDGFETYLAAAIIKKHTPVIVVDDKAKADFIIGGTSHVDKAGWAKTIFISGAPQAGASIAMKNKNGDLAWAYSVDKFNAARASQSTAEACAKHLKEFIEKEK